MSKHLAPEETNTTTKPESRLQALPKVLHFRFGEERRQYEREFSLRSMLPVLMAALTTILGMLPLITDPFYAAMAVTVMCGLGFATLLTLVVIPVNYALFFRLPSPE